MIPIKTYIFSLIQTCLERPQPLSFFGIIPGIEINQLFPYSKPVRNFVIRPLLKGTAK
jgi:hypothetical protein